MKSHVFRPLFVVIGLVVIILIARLFIVPDDFKVWERGYMYGWHRKANEEEWKAFKAKYKFNSEYCKTCHAEQYDKLIYSPHSIINCENCHGPALEHPSNPSRLHIDRSRQQCLRCHCRLAYPTSNRKNIKGIDPNAHNPDIECSMCHNPHNPDLRSLTGGSS